MPIIIALIVLKILETLKLQKEVEAVIYENSSGYDYKSDAAAERAGLREFDRVAYSQYRKTIGLCKPDCIYFVIF